MLIVQSSSDPNLDDWRSSFSVYLFIFYLFFYFIYLFIYFFFFFFSVSNVMLVLELKLKERFWVQNLDLKDWRNIVFLTTFKSK